MQSTGHKADLQAEKAEKAVKLSGENWGEIERQIFDLGVTSFSSVNQVVIKP
jgi:hypothetical protein